MIAPPPGQALLVVTGASGPVGGCDPSSAFDHLAVGPVMPIGWRKLGISHPTLEPGMAFWRSR